MKKYAIIVAGGLGQRLGSETPKQFLLVHERPIIFHSLDKFVAAADQVILVLPESHFERWAELCQQYHFNNPVQLVAGGNSRSESVMNGLLMLEGDGVVAIHDAVRPLVTSTLIQTLFKEAIEHGSAIPVIPMRESVRMKDPIMTRYVNRENFLVVQTPQCFDLKEIKMAYGQNSEINFSDDAGVFENAGMTVHHIPGESSNIKITFKEDIAIAEAILNMMKNP